MSALLAGIGSAASSVGTGLADSLGVTPGASFGTMLGQFLGNEAFGGGGHPDGAQAAPPNQAPLTQLYPQTAAQPSKTAVTPTAPVNPQAVNPMDYTPYQQGKNLAQQQLAGTK